MTPEQYEKDLAMVMAAWEPELSKFEGEDRLKLELRLRLTKVRQRCRWDHGFYSYMVVGRGRKVDGVTDMPLTEKQSEIAQAVVDMVWYKTLGMEELKEDRAYMLEKRKEMTSQGKSEDYLGWALRHSEKKVKAALRDWFKNGDPQWGGLPHKGKRYGEKKIEGLVSEAWEKVKKSLVSVMAGRSVGKTHLVADLINWFFFTWERSETFCLGPTSHQLNQVLWPEISRVSQYSESIYGSNSSIGFGKGKVFEKGSSFICPNKGVKDAKGSSLRETWFVRTIQLDQTKPIEDQMAGLSGKHADWMLIVVDEASGVPDHAYNVIHNTMEVIGQVNICIAIFNPNKSHGWALDGATGKKKEALGYRINGEECELITAQKIQNLIDAYGKDSTTYRVSVLGLPPKTDDGSFIPYEWMELSKERYTQTKPDDRAPVLFGIDTGLGGDKTVIAHRWGSRLEELYENNDQDVEQITMWILKRIVEHEPDHVYFERTGIAEAIYQALSKALKDRGCFKSVLHGIKPMSPARDRKKYASVMDELMCKVRDAFQDGTICLPPSRDRRYEELQAQLTIVELDKGSEDRDGRIKIKSKNTAEYRKKLKGATGDNKAKSPDHLDAFKLTFYHDMDVQSGFKKPRRDLYKPKQRPSSSGRYGWL
jgi:hypothetical protein